MDPNSPFAQNEFARHAEPDRTQQATATTPATDPLDAAAEAERRVRRRGSGARARRADARRRTARTRRSTRSTRAGWSAGATSTSRSTRTQWNEYVRKSQDSLRVLAEETGGIAVVNQNDFDKALKRIDAETSDYYVLGYYSKNPDPTQAPPPGRGEGRRATGAHTSFARKEYVLEAAAEAVVVRRRSKRPVSAAAALQPISPPLRARLRSAALRSARARSTRRPRPRRPLRPGTSRRYRRR